MREWSSHSHCYLRVSQQGARRREAASSHRDGELPGCFARPATGRAHAGTGFRYQDQRENGGSDRQPSPDDCGAERSQRGMHDEVFHKWRAAERRLRPHPPPDCVYIQARTGRSGQQITPVLKVWLRVCERTSVEDKSTSCDVGGSLSEVFGTTEVAPIVLVGAEGSNLFSGAS